MVDFTKRLSKTKREKVIDPLEIYGGLDRASDKGPLRPIQEHVLSAWHAQHRNKRDLIVKLHTGQGKTLIGLLLLQSKLNEAGGPVVYFCPNNQLIEQTCEQAKQFGFSICKSEKGGDLPAEFLDGKSIYITSIQKLFNGLTRFGLNHKSIGLTALLMDDCHACVDAIRDSVTIEVTRTVTDSKGMSKGTHPIFEKLFGLFSEPLREQGAGTFQDMENGNAASILAVPYWVWRERQGEVTKILADHSEDDAVKFVWPLLKDRIGECLCVFSGSGVEITPHAPPLEDFGSYWKAPHRIFMSATVTDDSFLVKGLGLPKDAILDPLRYPNETWSGEKMILLPSVIDGDLDRSTIVNEFGKPVPRRPYGVVALCPSFSGTKDWEAVGARIAARTTIDDAIRALKNGIREQVVVFANRYDGIDLPDECCRVLVFDSMPFGERRIEQYIQGCRADSEFARIRLARAIEQGLGRSVRGEKDYSVIIVAGAELVNNLRQARMREYLSSQTKVQVELGLEVAEYAKEDIKKGISPMAAFCALIDQCLKRDQGWKEFYVEKMNELKPEPVRHRGLEVFELELKAESEYLSGRIDRAIKTLQSIIDGHISSNAERGYYLQEMARYRYATSKTDANNIQVSAHRMNRFLFKPQDGFVVEKLEPVQTKRVSAIAAWVRQYENFEQLKLAVDEIISKLEFGVAADEFERALGELGKSLGFATERPDKEWKQGPDNLWCVKAGDYILFECKNEVSLERVEIYKEETGQMNNACGWFKTKYPGCEYTRLLVIPTNRLGKGAAFNEEVGIVRKTELTKLTKNVKRFFQEFAKFDLKDLPEDRIQELLEAHKLSVDDLKSEYQKAVYSGILRA